MKNSYIDGLKYELPHHFRSQSEDLKIKFDTDTVVKEDIVYWKSNGSVPPSDVLEFWSYVGKDFDYNKSIDTLDVQTKESIEAYVGANSGRKRSEEELFEMMSAFGEGEVVDIFTGEELKL